MSALMVFSPLLVFQAGRLRSNGSSGTALGCSVLDAAWSSSGHVHEVSAVR